MWNKNFKLVLIFSILSFWVSCKKEEVTTIESTIEAGQRVNLNVVGSLTDIDFDTAFPSYTGTCDNGISISLTNPVGISLLTGSCSSGVLTIKLAITGNAGAKSARLIAEDSNGIKESVAVDISGTIDGDVIPVGSTRSFTTLRQAITSGTLNDGDFIAIDPGTYDEGGSANNQIAIANSLTIEGQDASTTIIRPANNVDGGTSDAQSWVLTKDSTKTVHFKNLTFDGRAGTFAIKRAMRFHSLGSMDSCIVQNFRSSKYIGQGVQIRNSFTIKNSQFINIERDTMDVDGSLRTPSLVTVVIENNIFQGKGPSENPDNTSANNFLNYALWIYNGNVTVRSNTFKEYTAVSDPAPIKYDSTAIIVYQYYTNVHSTLSFQNNLFESSVGPAIALIVDNPTYGDLDVSFNYNSVLPAVGSGQAGDLGSGVQIDGTYNGGTLYDMTNNWWGYSGGADTDGSGAGATGAIISSSDDAIYDVSQHLTDGVDADPSAPGFQRP